MIPRLAAGLYRHSNPHAIRTALRSGLSYIDTAFNYAGGQSAKLLGDELQRWPDRAAVAVSSKIGYFPGPHRDEHDLSTERLLSAARSTSSYLRRPPDLLLLHNPEESIRDQNPAVDIRPAVAVMEHIVESGFAKAWGISSWRGFSGLFTVNDWVSTAQGTPPTAVMVPGSLAEPRYIEQAFSGFGPIADASVLGLDVHVFAPFAGGALSTVSARNTLRALGIGRAHPANTVATASLAVVATTPGVTHIVAGFSSSQHITQAVRVLANPADHDLSKRFLEALHNRSI